MTEIEKIDKVLEFILKCEQPPKRSASEVAKEIDCFITTKESIEILDKLFKDGFVIKEIQSLDGTAYYFSSFEGRLFLMNGGYKKQIESQKNETNKNKSITITNIVISLAVVFVSVLNYIATDKANDNRDNELNYKLKIKTLNIKIDSLKILTNQKSVPKSPLIHKQNK